MNYLHHGGVCQFMKDKAIRPYEYFYIHCIVDKMGVKLSDSLRKFTVGYFTESYDFSLKDTLKVIASDETERLILACILTGDIEITPAERYLPDVNDIYYYLDDNNNSYPDDVNIRRVAWENSLDDYARYDLGNCFRLEKEAWLAAENNFYNDASARHKIKSDEYKAKAFAMVK